MEWPNRDSNYIFFASSMTTGSFACAGHGGGGWPGFFGSCFGFGPGSG